MTLKTVILIGFLGSLIGCSNNPEGPGRSVANAQPDRALTDAPAAAPPMSAETAPTDNTGAAGNIADSGPPNPSTSNAGVSTDTATPSTAEECTRRGGTWRKAGLMKLDVCDLPMADAGKACQNDSECESVCIAPDGVARSGTVTGQCYHSNITVGTCLTLIDGGRIAQAQCAD